jgi:hypothetical protein
LSLIVLKAARVVNGWLSLPSHDEEQAPALLLMNQILLAMAMRAVAVAVLPPAVVAV